MKALDDLNLYNANQSWNAVQHFEHKGRKLKVAICRNAYDFQSSAKIAIQDKNTLGWLPLAAIPYPQMKTQMSYVVTNAKAVGPEHDARTVQLDVNTLLEKAKMLID